MHTCEYNRHPCYSPLSLTPPLGSIVGPKNVLRRGEMTFCTADGSYASSKRVMIHVPVKRRTMLAAHKPRYNDSPRNSSLNAV
jgi:hypothetical protein